MKIDIGCFAFRYSKISFGKFYDYFVHVALVRKDMFIYQGFIFGFLPRAYYLCHLPNSRLRRSDTANNREASPVEICESLA